MKKKLLTAFVLGTLSASLAACGSGASTTATTAATAAAEGSTASATQRADTGTPAQGGSFIYGLATEVDNLDPFASTTADARSIYFNIYEGLLKCNEDGNFQPAIASDYQVSDDGLTYTFTLRDNVLFHNGNPVTTDDVLYSIQLAIDSKITGYDNIDTFTAPDDKTIVITLKTPDGDFPAEVCQAIVPKDSDNNGELATAPIGTGPYELTDFAVQDHLTLTRNDNYWGTPAYLDTVTVKFIDSSADLLVNYQSGAIDGFVANGAITEQVDKSTSVINVGNSNAVQMLALNNTAAPFDNPEVRQAVSYAVDSDEIIDTACYGYGVKLGTAMIPGLKDYFDDSLTDTYDVDDDKAKELLADAGYADGFTFTVKVPSVYQVHLDTAQIIVNELAKVGITMNIEQVDWATWLENVYTNRDYEATIISVDGSIASPTSFLSRYVSDAGNNFVNYSSADFDAAYESAASALSQDDRIAGFKKCEQILTQDAASVYIQDISNILVYTDRFGGFASYPLYATDFAAIYQVQ